MNTWTTIQHNEANPADAPKARAADLRRSLGRKMDFSLYNPKETDEIEALFTKTFCDSEGESEGAIVGDLAGELIRSTDENDFYGFVARDDVDLVGSILFSRMWFERKIDAFILAPVAIRTDCQRRGIGQKLINFGLNALKNCGVELVLTYGDPRFYSMVGFSVVTENVISPPFKLSQPEGWMAQSLVGDQIDPIQGKSRCVEALNKPKYW
ncbi:Predicted N-acetyltransferase YhbS [Nitrosomonas marina]|uniref:Predicted N-acetyltransferase YhbS n=1 Tax=Nitrosomonas marina TaxID=917 RepID=A0A1I0GCP4_9PROT|nr:N-acetyltransferase [Nitrosomonas marina]SET67789.1 Predicted N-acetyltransferase YhbS [Nitrosomonas marina]